jgi:hypothetical protein
MLVRPYQGGSVNLATPKAHRCRFNFLGLGKLTISMLVGSIKYVRPTLLKFDNVACFKINVFKIIIKRALIANQFCHDPNPGSVTGNAGAVPEGHPARAKPQNRHIKIIIYSKIRSIS